MRGRILFKQSKVVNNVVGRSVSKVVKALQHAIHTRLNYRSNVAGIVKLVSSANLREHYNKKGLW